MENNTLVVMNVCGFAAAQCGKALPSGGVHQIRGCASNIGGVAAEDQVDGKPDA